MVVIPVPVPVAASNKTDALDPLTGISLIRRNSICGGKTTEHHQGNPCWQWLMNNYFWWSMMAWRWEQLVMPPPIPIGCLYRICAAWQKSRITLCQWVHRNRKNNACAYRKSTSWPSACDRTSLVIFGVQNRALQHGTQRSHRGPLLCIIQAAVPSFAALAVSASASPAGFFNCAAHWQQCYILWFWLQSQPSFQQCVGPRCE